MRRVVRELGLDAGPGQQAPAPDPGKPRVDGVRGLPRRDEDRGPVALAQAPLDQVGQDLPTPGAGRAEDEVHQGLVIGDAQNLKTLFCAALRIQWSTSTSAVIASTIGTARGRTHGSWRPLPASSAGSPSRSTVCWGFMIVAVGLKATLKKISSPLLIPPWIPPERLVAVPMRPSFGTNASLCSEPLRQRPREAAADLEPLGRRQGQHRLREVGLQPVEDRLAQPRGNAAHTAPDDAPHRVALGADLLDPA